MWTRLTHWSRLLAAVKQRRLAYRLNWNISSCYSTWAGKSPVLLTCLIHDIKQLRNRGLFPCLHSLVEAMLGEFEIVMQTWESVKGCITVEKSSNFQGYFSKRIRQMKENAVLLLLERNMFSGYVLIFPTSQSKCHLTTRNRSKFVWCYNPVHVYMLSSKHTQ